MTFLNNLLKAPLAYANRQPHAAWAMVGVSLFFLKFSIYRTSYQMSYGPWIQEREAELSKLKA